MRHVRRRWRVFGRRDDRLRAVDQPLALARRRSSSLGAADMVSVCRAPDAGAARNAGRDARPRQRGELACSSARRTSSASSNRACWPPPLGTVPAVVLGGVGTLVVAALWAALVPGLARCATSSSDSWGVGVAPLRLAAAARPRPLPRWRGERGHCWLVGQGGCGSRGPARSAAADFLRQGDRFRRVLYVPSTQADAVRPRCRAARRPPPACACLHAWRSPARP